jgi:hypothetical protein
VPRLEVADDQTWLASVGVIPRTEEVTDDESVRELRMTWDINDRSVRVRHHRSGEIVTDLYRDLATLLTVVRTGAAREIIIEYGSTGWSGHTRIQLRPHVLVEDKVLRS